MPALDVLAEFKLALAELRESPTLVNSYSLDTYASLKLSAVRNYLFEAFDEEPDGTFIKESLARVIVSHFPDKRAIRLLIRDHSWSEGDFTGMRGFVDFCESHGNPFPKNPHVDAFLERYQEYKENPNAKTIAGLKAILAQDPQGLRPVAFDTLDWEGERQHQLVLADAMAGAFGIDVEPLPDRFKAACASLRQCCDEGAIMYVESIFDSHSVALYPLMVEEVAKDNDPLDIKETFAMLMLGHFPHRESVELLVNTFDWNEWDFDDMPGFDQFCQQNGSPFPKEKREEYFLWAYEWYRSSPDPENLPRLHLAIKRDPESVRDIVMKTLAEESNEAVRASLAKLAAEFYGA